MPFTQLTLSKLSLRECFLLIQEMELEGTAKSKRLDVNINIYIEREPLV